MSKRELTRKVRSTTVQGSGSYVIFKKIRVRDMREIQDRFAEIDNEDSSAQMDLTVELLKEYVIEWNWVDEKNEPLPLPGEDESVINELTDEELLFLSENLTGNTDTKK